MSSIVSDSYIDATCRVRTDGLFSELFPTISGVRQGCVAALHLFNTAVDFWLKETLDRCPDLGVSLHQQVTDICYADDVVIFAELIDTISHALEVLSEKATPLGLSINWTKSKTVAL